MLLPSVDSRVDVQMTKRTAICSSKRLSRETLFLLSMGFVGLLMDCFLASGALLVILTICTLSDQMRGKGTDFNPLATLAADNKHRASVKVVHIFVIFFNKSFIDSFTKLALLILIY